MYSGGNHLMNEEQSLREIHEIREKLFLMKKKEKRNQLLEIRKKYKELFI